ncbi:MAG: HEPN domain-containing protein [Candidatus Bathyarchaeia archaeon]
MNGKRFKDWFSEALEDLSIAKILLREKKYAASCFHSQQSAEKAVKALLLFFGRFEFAYSVFELLLTMRKLNLNVTDEYIRYARVLDRYYIPARYSNAFEKDASHEYFLERDAEEAIRFAEEIIKLVERKVKQN